MYPSLFEEQYIHSAHLKIAGCMVVNVCFGEQFAKRSPYEIILDETEWFLKRKGQKCCQCSFLPEPGWYQKTIDETTNVRRVLRLHGTNTLADATFAKCEFVDKGKACLFCSFPRDTVQEEWKISHLSRAVSVALSENERYSIALSEGARASDEETTQYFGAALGEIRRVAPDVDVSIEMIAPRDLGVIDALIDGGATSLIMNLEFHDEELRRIFCPGKGQVSRDTYVAAWAYGVKRLGKGKVSSVLIAGIEREDLTIEAALTMIDLGVIPTIIPFRPYDNSQLRNMRVTSPDVLLNIEEVVRFRLREAGLDPRMQGACTSCGACSLETDYDY
jgi:hypothetical protein